MLDCSKFLDIRYQCGSVNRSCEGELCKKDKKENDKEAKKREREVSDHESNKMFI